MTERSSASTSSATVVMAALPAGAELARRERAAVLVTSGRAMGEIFALEGPSTVGRDCDCDLVLRDDGISRRHCRFSREGDDVLIEDLGSTNGTWVNRVRIRRCRLRHGDRIRLGVNTGLSFVLQDEEEDAQMRDLYRAASRDALTGAYNRRYFLERLEAELAYTARHRTPLSLIVFDCDNFKEINDSYGHAAGDAVLSQLGELVLATTREEDIVARWGGDEFAILARGVGDKGIYLLAERLRSAVAESVFSDDGVELRLTLSVGTATTCDGSVSAEGFFRKGDAALYEVKRSGRDGVHPRPM